MTTLASESDKTDDASFLTWWFGLEEALSQILVSLSTATRGINFASSSEISPEMPIYIFGKRGLTWLVGYNARPRQLSTKAHR